MRKPRELIDDIMNGKKVSFMEYLIALRSYGELEFSYKGKVYVTLRLNNEYSKECKYEVWDRTKDFYVLFENANYKNAQVFDTIEQAHEEAKLGGQLIKDIFDEMTDVGELGSDSWHGFSYVHDHKWYGEDRGPARKPDVVNYPK